MALRIRVTTQARLFKERKRQHIERGYHIEGEQPIPLNGLSSFIAVRDVPQDGMRCGVQASACSQDPILRLFDGA
jgi:hypothetical protein